MAHPAYSGDDFYCDMALSGKVPLVDLGAGGEALLMSIMRVVRQVAAEVLAEHGACRVLTNLGDYQDSKHLHYHICCGEPQ